MDDQLGQHWIVVGRNVRAGGNPAIDANVVGEGDIGQDTGRRLEIVDGVFGIEPHFDRRAAGGRQFGQIGRIAGRGLHHPRDEIDAEHAFGYRMFDLQARIDLEEIEFVAGVVIDEFDRACRAVVNGGAERFRCGQHARPRGRGKIGRWCFLDDFLVASLQRAVALAEGHHLAAAIAENLHLDVTRVVDAAFEKDPGFVEEIQCQALH